MNMSDTDTDEEKYTITPYGLLGRVIDEDSAQAAVDALTLYMLRHAKPGHFLGLVADGGHLAFVQVRKEEE
jgi:hypothetical protein